MLGQLAAGQDEERLASDHDVRVVGVVVHLGGVLHLQVVRQLETSGAFAVRLCVRTSATT